ncbi:site-specific integrase [Ancylobacter sp. Lp-2]|uniref:tyrosine-type recombinase/integrase n=1 Tax=Ancylobacter sp. Lp-2 TaxID=2881339 RepID=UPI001E326CC3|nr:tyrosine-type recombinase/integrase [Ancylobacter sp. Lp-2]MCB4767848.1 site-specific integrase [Ancylobacter sp. Lp-2]
MLFRLVRPMRRSDTRNHQFALRIPKDLKSRMVGMMLEIPLGDGFVSVPITEKTHYIRFSLRTAEPSDVKRRQAAALQHVESIFASLRASAPVALTHKQCVALAGEVYRAWAGELESFRTRTVFEQTPGDDADLALDFELEALAVRHATEELQKLDSAALERQIGPLVDRMLMRHGIVAVDVRSRSMLLMEVPKALTEGLEAHARKVGGDYSPDPKSERFPEWQKPSTPRLAAGAAAESKPGRLTLDDLLEGWWKEAKAAGRKQSTYESYRRTVTAFAAFLKHKDPRQITPEDVIAYKDHRIAEGVSAKTVKDSDLAGLKTVLGWAAANRKIATNPAAGATLRIGRKKRLRSPAFTDGEVRAILSKAAAYRQGNAESWQMASAKRWVPWLCAFTGARLGEIVQLRRQDVRQEGGRWVIHITPEAGTVKTNEARDVPLHAQLVEMGFPEFVAAAPEARLFMVLSGEGEEAWRKAWRTAKNRVTEFARGALGDVEVAPNHGWRHRFETLAIEQGFNGRVADALVGHAPGRVADTYGEVTLSARVTAIDKLPRVALEVAPFDVASLRWDVRDRGGRGVKKRVLVPRNRPKVRRGKGAHPKASSPGVS